ncbi:hypothetical protein Aperf_G00000028038 [Anoplocephala perfoliata]
MSLFTPINQKRLTNISIVRIRKNGRRYELACFPNKVKAWRDKLNVSKGQLAKKSDLYRDFETEDVEAIILRILQEGEIPVSGMERKYISESLSRDVAKIISEKCINMETNRPYTVTMVEKMMKECHINLQPNKSAKHQALKAIEKLIESGKYKIKPAMMEIVISLDPKIVDSVSPNILLHVHHITRQGLNAEGIFEMKAVIEQKDYHFLTGTLNEFAKNRYCVEIIGAARPDASSGKKKPPLPSSSVPLPETASIPEEDPPEMLSNPPASPTPITPPTEVGDDDGSGDGTNEPPKIDSHYKQRKNNRRRKDWVAANEESA